MAPLSMRIARAMWEIKLEARGLGSENSTEAEEHLTPSDENTLQCLALAFATVSVASAVLAFYWFLKMRRSFRHDLIMLLIQSDMFKALWFMVYPAVVFANGPVSSKSTFCQVNGFFVALGIEASDIAVLMIAVHSALYIFRPRASGGEGGLYPYRHFAYIVWFFFPITMASLAFVNGGNAYVDEGTYCYLPIRPFWYGLALSWIPRYVIFLFILGIYASIYFYVRKKFRGFSKESDLRSERISRAQRGSKRQERNSMPPTLACHGLIPDPSRQASLATEPDGRKQSVSIVESANGAPLMPTGTSRFIWANILANDESLSHAIPSELASVDSDEIIVPSTPQPAYTGSTPSPPRDIEIVNPSQSRATFGSTKSPETKHPVSGVFSGPRHDPGLVSTATYPDTRLQLVDTQMQNLEVSEMLQTREKIRRQLRFLFIYPLVYLGMWIAPFVSHVLQYDDRFAINPPFGLTCATTIFLCCQAAVDCWLFSTREKPWKHIAGNEAGFWGSLRFWSGWQGVAGRRRRNSHGPGKTSEEMAREARAAYKRREEELAQRRSDAVTVAVQDAKSGQQQHRRDRSWWEAAGLDGAMDTAREERDDPMEDLGLYLAPGSLSSAERTNASPTGSQPSDDLSGTNATNDINDENTTELAHANETDLSSI